MSNTLETKVTWEELRNIHFLSENKAVIGNKLFTFERGDTMNDLLKDAMNEFMSRDYLIIYGYEKVEEYVPGASDELKTLEEMYENALKKLIIERDKYCNKWGHLLSGEAMFMEPDIHELKDALYDAYIYSFKKDRERIFWKFISPLIGDVFFFMLCDEDDSDYAVELAEKFFDVFYPTVKELGENGTLDWYTPYTLLEARAKSQKK